MRRPSQWILLAWAFLVFCGSQNLQAQSDQLTLEDFEELEAKVVAVAKNCMAASVGLGSKERPENGSAVVVSKDGLLLTAYHVVQGLPDDNMIVSFVDGKKVRAKKLGGVPKLDIAMAQIIDEGEYPFVDVGDMAAVKNGDWCVSIAHAEGFQSDRTPPVRLGRVVNRINPGGFLQMTSTLIGGDSGGPTFDLDGKVIGIHSNIGGSLSQNQACPISDFTKKDHWQRLLDGEVWGTPEEEAKKRKEAAEKRKKEAEKKKKQQEGAEKDGKDTEKGDKDSGDDSKESDKDESASPPKLELKSKDETAESKKSESSKVEGEPDSEGKTQSPPEEMKAEAQSGDATAENEKTKATDKTEGETENAESGESKSEEGSEKADAEKPAPKKTVRPRRSKPKEIETSLNAFETFSEKYEQAIVRFWRRGRMICSGLILTRDGIIVTKSSELMSRNFEIELPNGELLEGKVLKRVKSNDLLFVKVDRSFNEVIDLRQTQQEADAIRTLPLGSIVVAVGFGGQPVSMGVKSVEIRNLMKAGYAVLGVTLGTKQDDLSIKSLTRDSAAKKSGMRPGDVIRKIGGKEMKTLDQLRETLRGLEPNTRVPVEFERDGRVAASLVKLGSSAARSDQGSMNYPQGGRISRKRVEFTEALQSDTPFDPKHVGGPLIDRNGRLLGINIARAGRIKSYTLPCTTVIKELKSLTESERED